MQQAAKKKKSTAHLYHKMADSVVTCIDWGLSPFGDVRKNTLLSVMAERIIPNITVPVPGEKSLKFWCFGGWSTYRARSVLEKEPLTIQWIQKIEPESIFWDIGANVGVFSIFAAVVKDLKTYAFEPSLSNMAVFAHNIELNKVDHLVTALPIAFTDKTGLDYLNMQSTGAGNTGAQFSADTIDSPTVFKQACLGWTMDDFIESYKVPVPNYIKMDVDGIEVKILKASPKLLANRNLKSLILEFSVDSQDFLESKILLEQNGFEITESEPTVPGRETMKNFIFSRRK